MSIKFNNLEEIDKIPFEEKFDHINNHNSQYNNKSSIFLDWKK